MKGDKDMTRIIMFFGIIASALVCWYLILEAVDWLITNFPDIMGRIRWRK
jgi:hypothetical protein